MNGSSRRVRTVLVLVVLTVLIAAVLPALRPLLTSPRRATDIPLAGADLVRMMAVEALTGLWFLAVGASLGSFLNVVVYRVPRRESIIWRPSYCPRCHSPIRLTDNIPLFGWVLLRGRCRDCWLPISVRYPLVELAFGWIVWGLSQWELISGGANLPLRPLNRLAGATWVVWTPDWELLAIFGYHVLLMFLLAAWSLMAWDGQQPTRRFASFALATGAGLAVLMPSLHPLPPLDPQVWQVLVAPATADRTLAGLGVLAGMGLGGTLGALAVGLSRTRSQHRLNDEVSTLGGDSTASHEDTSTAHDRSSAPQSENRPPGEAESQLADEDAPSMTAAPIAAASARTAIPGPPEEEHQAGMPGEPTEQVAEAMTGDQEPTSETAVSPLPQRRLEVRRLNAMLSGATAGAFLGWQGVLTASLLTAILRAAARLPWTTALWPGTLLLVLLWRPLWRWGWSPGATLSAANAATAWGTLALMVAVAAGGVVVHKFRRARSPAQGTSG